jgi:putative Holliday junction resolvase
MAKYLGIDYGTKRVGIAVSDERGAIAFPREIIPNDRALVPYIIDLVRAENISIIVVGESKDKDGNDNAIMAEARRFAKALEEELAVTVIFEPEYYSSAEARRLSLEAGGAEDSFVDSRAATVILNRYLERSRANGDLT